MSVRSHVEILRRVPLFADADIVHLQVLAFATEVVELPPGQFLFREGERAGAAYLILEGEAHVSRREERAQSVVATPERSALVGELTMLADTPCYASVRATSPIKAIRIPRDLFYRVAQEFPGFAAHVARAMTRRLEGTMADLREVQTQLADLPPSAATHSVGDDTNGASRR
jgi:CRP/FNR family cyclic AMP-dependent transcriptional regulator